jgi:hypothetical protein
MAVNREYRRVWVAMLYLAWVADVFGAVRNSPRLLSTRRAARVEAEGWITKMAVGPITWQTIDNQTIIGCNRTHAIVVYSILLPRDDPQVRIASASGLAS